MTTALDHWTGPAGDAYTERNSIDLPARRILWNQILTSIGPLSPRTILEVGANIGQNLAALQELLGNRTLMLAIEPNKLARKRLAEVIPESNIIQGSAQNLFLKSNSVDLVFTSGVLIHIPPEELQRACGEIYRVSKKFIIAIEYFAAEPETKVYRGEADRLWKRDFGAFYIQQFGCQPVACGFAWKETTGLDNLTWWVLKK